MGPFSYRRLMSRKNAPDKLFAAGDVAILEHGAHVSIVGTRKPSPEGTSQAIRLAAALASKGVVVVSGRAEGIDTSAHD
jgi:DNA processing protein